MTDTYKLIVVDDEFIIRDGLMQFKWEKLGFTVAGGASNGKEALELMGETSVDFLITDIKMPVMDGLELIEKVQQKYPATKILILTGYKDFEYARKAIKAGVVEYLLKPVELHELEELALKIKTTIDSERNQIELISNYQEKLKGSIPMATRNFLRSLIEGSADDICEIEEKMDLLEIYLKRKFYTCAVFRADFGPDNGKDFSQIRHQWESRLDRYLDENKYGYLHPDKSYETIVLFNLDVPNHTISANEVIIHAVTDILGIFHEVSGETGGYSMHAGVGCIYEYISYLPEAYKQARQQIERSFFEEKTKAFYAWRDQGGHKSDFSYPYEEQRIVIDAVLDGDAERASAAMIALWDSFQQVTADMDPRYFRNIIAQFLCTLESRLNRHGVSLGGIANIEPPFIDYLEPLQTVSALRIHIENLIISVTDHVAKINNEERSSAHQAVQRVVRFINEHYSERITLHEVAKTVFLNSSYLSIQFKKEMGKNFTDFLKNIRIEKAKALIRDTDMKAYEIGEYVGYTDYKYFSETFKAVTGCSPMEYRQRQIVPEGEL